MAEYDKLTPDGEKLKARVEEVRRLHVRVGFQAGKDIYQLGEDNTAADVMDVAMWNELGTSNSPSRPFMRDSVDNHQEEIQNFSQRYVKQLIEGSVSAQQMYAAIGAYLVGLVQTEITDGQFAPNSPYTIKKKKSDKPLIDTGFMRQSVHYIIQEKKGDDDE